MRAKQYLQSQIPKFRNFKKALLLITNHFILIFYAELSKIYKNETNTVYLTFDDGPSQRTIEILDILKERNVKANLLCNWERWRNGKNYHEKDS